MLCLGLLYGFEFGCIFFKLVDVETGLFLNKESLTRLVAKLGILCRFQTLKSLQLVLLAFFAIVLCDCLFFLFGSKIFYLFA